MVPEHFHPLQLLVSVLLHQYFNNSYCVTVLTERDFNIISLPSISYVRLKYDRERLLDDLLKASDMGCLDYLIQLTEPKRFITTLDKVTHLGNLRRSDRKIILLPETEDVDASAPKLLNVLKLKEAAFIADLLLVIPVNSSTECKLYELVTHKYVGPDAEADNPVYLDQWNSCSERFETSANLFRNKMSNLYGKSVRVACFHFKPFSVLDIDDGHDRSGYFDGIDFRIVEQLCRRINCKVDLVRDDANSWGLVFENGTGVGVLGNVYEDKADIGIGGIGFWDKYFQLLDVTAAIERCSITAIAPAPGTLSKWELPFLAFHWKIWLLIFVSSIFIGVALTVTNRFSTKGVIFKIIRLIVAQPQRDREWRIRRITGLLLMMTIIVYSAYGAGLSSLFTVTKYEKSIDTVQDIVDRQVEWAAVHEVWVLMLKQSEEEKIKKLLKLFRSYGPDTMKAKFYERKIAFAVVTLTAGTIATHEYSMTRDVVPDYTIMLEDLYFSHSTLIGRKSSPYVTKLNELIGRLHEAGLLLAWENQISRRYMDYKVQLALKYSRRKKETVTGPLGYHDLVGVFSIYGFGVIAAIIKFLTEYIPVARRNKQEINTIQN